MRFYTSDPHYWHKNVIAYCNRPFASVEEMNEKLIVNWNSVVKPEDETYIIGDFAFAGTIKVTEILGRLHGTKHLIIGNHDWANFKPHRFAALGFKSAQERAKIQVPGLGSVLLCHFPYLGTPHPDLRYLDKRPEDKGDWLFHGHIHNGEGSWRIKGRQVNVGVDVWDYFPIAEDFLVQEINNDEL